MPVLQGILAAVLLLTGVAPSWAQGYPNRPVRVVVGFPAGGPTDVIARLVSQKLSDSLGQQFFVENIGGAGGNTAAGQVARVTPDGYTIMAISTGFLVNPSLYAKVPYDPIKDFTAVTLVAVSPNVVVVNPQVPAKSLPELVQLIRDNPGKYSYAGPGVGSTPHLGGELFRLTYKLDLVHVPFAGAAPAVQSTIGGHTPIAFTALPSSLSAIQSGQVRAIGVAATERAEGIPDVPTERSGRLYADRHRCAGRYAKRDRRAAFSRDRQERRTARCTGAACGAGLQAGRQYVRRVRRAHQAGNGKVGQSGARRESEDRVTRRQLWIFTRSLPLRTMRAISMVEQAMLLVISILLEASVAVIAVLAARQGRPYVYGLAFTFVAYVIYDLARFMAWPVEGPLLSGLFLLATVAALVAVWGLYRNPPGKSDASSHADRTS